MTAALRRWSFLSVGERRSIFVIAGGIMLAALVALLLAGGTPMRIAAAVALVVAPLAGYLALERPVLFPYGLYVLMMPYDVLLVVHTNSTFTKMVGEAAGLCCFFYCLRVRRIAPVQTPLIALLMLLLWMSLGTLWSVDAGATLFWLQSYFGLALLYAALALMPVQLRDFRILLGIVAAAFTVAAVFGIHTFHHDPSLHTLNELDRERVSLQLGDNEIDQNHFANAFLFPIAILVTFLLRSRWLSVKVLCAGAVFLMVAAMISSGSREAFIALGIMTAYMLWRGRNRIQLFVLATVCALAAAPFGMVLSARFTKFFDQGPGGRTSIWAVAIEGFKHYWLTGSGLGTFAMVYDRFYLSVAQLHPDGWGRPAHDMLLHFAVELGILGVALTVWFVVAHFRMLRTIVREHPMYDYRVMVEAGMIGLIVVSFFIDLFNYKYTWLVLASAMQVAYLGTTMRRARERDVPLEAAA